jgi:hypothetical protein
VWQKEMMPGKRKVRSFVHISFLPGPPSADEWKRDFLRDWRESLIKADKLRLSRRSGEEDFWEGDKAAADIAKFRYSDQLLYQQGEDASRFLLQVVREIEICRTFYTDTVAINKEFARLEEVLRSTTKKLKKFTSRSLPIVTRRVARSVTEDIESTIRDLPQLKNEFWDKSLEYTTSELRQLWVELKNLKDNESQVEYSAPDWVAEVDAAVFNWKLPTQPRKRDNLDTRLQVRLAAIIRCHFPELPMRTVARLVTLMYICADLAKVREGHLFVVRSGAHKPKKNELTVAKVEKKLNNAAPGPGADPDAFWRL